MENKRFSVYKVHKANEGCLLAAYDAEQMLLRDQERLGIFRNATKNREQEISMATAHLYGLHL